jgi:hypothetical protein
MVKLGSLNISTPRLIFEIEVQHSSKRAPTAFERMILSLYERFKQDKNYGALPLQQIFTEILGVPNSGDFLMFTLNELIAIDVIRCQKSLSEIGAICLLDIEVTERGNALINDNQLPSVMKKNTESVIYDPINKHLSKTVGIDLDKESKGHSLDVASFLGITPLDSIRNFILQQKYAWLDKDSSIDSVSITNESVAWSSISADVSIDDCKIDIAFQDDNYSHYVSALPGSSVLEQVLGNDLFGVPWGNSGDSHFIYEDKGNGSATDRFLPLGYVLKKHCDNSRVWLINSLELSWCSRLQISSGHVVVFFRSDAPESEFTLNWNEDNSGCHIEMGGKFPFEGYHLAIDGYLIQSLDSNITIGRDIITLPLAKAVATDGAQMQLKITLDQIEASVARADDLDDKLSPILWLTKELFWGSYVPKAASFCTTFVDIVEFLDKARDKAKHRWGNVDTADFEAPSREVLTEFLQQDINDDDEIAELSLTYHWLEEALSRSSNDT